MKSPEHLWCGQGSAESKEIQRPMICGSSGSLNQAGERDTQFFTRHKPLEPGSFQDHVFQSLETGSARPLSDISPQQLLGQDAGVTSVNVAQGNMTIRTKGRCDNYNSLVI